MAWWEKWLLGIGTIAAMVSIIPLMVWGGSGSLSRAWQALRQYLLIMGAFVAVAGGLGMVMAVAEHGLGPILQAITGH